jgi:Holliday junction resolvase RusA-like endonuclease
MGERLTVQVWWLRRWAGGREPTAPPTEGSTWAFIDPRSHKTRTKHDNPLLDAWRKQIAMQVAAARPSGWPRDGAYAVDLLFQIRRARARVGHDRPTQRPDVEKLARAVFDALTGVVYDDDSQVVQLTARKEYGVAVGPPGVQITIELL